jgi:hypothetical protein
MATLAAGSKGMPIGVPSGLSVGIFGGQMEVLNGRRFLEMLLMGMVGAGAASSLSPDPKLLSMIPPDVQIVAGTGAPGGFLMFRQESVVDLRDFRALVGVDDSKLIRQFFVVAGTEDADARVEHSLLAVGRFDHARIYKSCIENGGRLREYRGIQILELKQYSRDRGIFNDLRWLAIIGSDLALLGTVSNVREELDRHEDHVPVDSNLAQRLSKLSNDDATWYLMPKLRLDDETRQALGSLSPHLVGAELYTVPFQFGIRYGRRVRFDFEFNRADPTVAEVVSAFRVRLHSGHDSDVWSFVSGPSDNGQRDPIRGAISVSKTRYAEWLEEIRSRRRIDGEPSIH